MPRIRLLTSLPLGLWDSSIYHEQGARGSKDYIEHLDLAGGGTGSKRRESPFMKIVDATFMSIPGGNIGLGKDC